MAYDSVAVANALVSLLGGLAGMGVVQIGAPSSVGPQVSGYVTMGGQRNVRKATGVTQRDSRFMCMLAYRVDGSEGTAETVLMGLVDAAQVALHADLTLGGICHDLSVDATGADEPDYQLRAGKEYREYPLIVTVVQRDVFAVNP